MDEAFAGEIRKPNPVAFSATEAGGRGVSGGRYPADQSDYI